MTTTRISVAALAAGNAMYFWMSLAHVVLPLGRIWSNSWKPPSLSIL